VTQALWSQAAATACRDRGFEVSNAVTIEEHVLAALIQPVSRWADAKHLRFIVKEVLYGEEPALFWPCRVFFPTLSRTLLLVPPLVTLSTHKGW
jgi:hypothetical protein